MQLQKPTNKGTLDLARFAQLPSDLASGSTSMEGIGSPVTSTHVIGGPHNKGGKMKCARPNKAIYGIFQLGL